MEFKDKDLVTSLLKDKQEVKMEDRVLIVASAGPSETKGASKTNGSSKTSKKKAKVNDENRKTKTKAKPAGTWTATSISILCSASSSACQFDVTCPPLCSCSEAQQHAVFEQDVLRNDGKKPQEVVSLSR